MFKEEEHNWIRKKCIVEERGVEGVKYLKKNVWWGGGRGGGRRGRGGGPPPSLIKRDTVMVEWGYSEEGEGKRRRRPGRRQNVTRFMWVITMITIVILDELLLLMRCRQFRREARGAINRLIEVLETPSEPIRPYLVRIQDPIRFYRDLGHGTPPNASPGRRRSWRPSWSHGGHLGAMAAILEPWRPR